MLWDGFLFDEKPRYTMDTERFPSSVMASHATFSPRRRLIQKVSASIKAFHGDYKDVVYLERLLPREKLSPQVTDEGEKRQQGNPPIRRLSLTVSSKRNDA